MRVLVCGGRDFADRARLTRVLDSLVKSAIAVGDPVTAIIHGGATGADGLAGLWARGAGVHEVRFPADWQTHGKAAGPIRNLQMLTEGRPDLVIAFPGGKGTANMIEQARTAGVRVMTFAAEAESRGTP